MTIVAVLGARRRRQGIGEFVARSFAEAGAEVRAVVGTSAATAAEACRNLRERHGLECRAYQDLGTCLECERPRILAICTPYGFHRRQLLAAAAAGVHCLCEKPLWWEPHPDRAAETARLIAAFADRGLFLAQITQWPQTLPDFHRLHPEIAGRAVERFEMGLAPITTGAAMVLDAAPHPLSMLRHLLGCGAVERPRAGFRDGTCRILDLTFDYRHATGSAEVSCRFETVERPPRPASYSINGRQVERRIDPASYGMELWSGDRGIRIEDPLRSLVAEFLRRAETGALPDRSDLVQSITDLEVLVSAAEEAEKDSGAQVESRSRSLSAPPEDRGVFHGQDRPSRSA